MFDAGSEAGTYDSGDDRLPQKRQYTLKGIEADTIRLMRFAANKEGMKIGSWVSLRMKEAAERALSNSNVSPGSAAGNSEVAASEEVAAILRHITVEYEAQLSAVNERFSKLERELHEI